MNKRTLLERALVHPESLRFAETLALAEAFSFRVVKLRGSHHILSHPDVREFINLQDVAGTANPYQGRQLGADRAVQSVFARRRMKDYHINIVWGEEDGGYIAGIPDLASCSAFGDMPEEALRQVETAEEAWLAAARAEGRPVPAPRYRPVIHQTS